MQGHSEGRSTRLGVFPSFRHCAMMPRMSYACIFIHTVLVCQNRRNWLTPEVQPRLHAFLGGIATGLRASLLAANGVADHSHLLLSISTARGMGEMMRELKTRSSRWMHDEMRLPQFAWQASTPRSAYRRQHAPELSNILRTRRSITGSSIFAKRCWRF